MTGTHFHTDCYSFSGSETTLMLLLGDAADRGAEYRFTFRRCADYEEGLRRHLPARVRARGLRLPGVMRVPLRQLCFLYDLLRLTLLFRSDRPQVLHVNNGGLPGAVSCNAAAIAGRLAGVPAVIYVVNNLAFPYDRPGRWLDYPIDRLLARSVTRFVTGSHAAGEALREVLRLPVHQHVVLPNGVEQRRPSRPGRETRAQLGLAAGDTVIAVVARLEERKGHRHLLTALTLLPADQLDSVRVLVAGAGPERSRLEQLVAELGLGDVVQFLGEHPDPWSLYDAADLVVLPSVGHEDLPIVVIEAMAAGLPVVASRVAGTVELIDDGVTGELVEPARPGQLAAAISDLLADPDRRETMGKAATVRYEATYTPERVVASYRALTEELVG